MDKTTAFQRRINHEQVPSPQILQPVFASFETSSVSNTEDFFVASSQYILYRKWYNKSVKPLEFIVLAVKRAYVDFPEEIQDDFGFALFQVQEGKRPSIAKSFSGSIDELRENDDQNKTYRVVYIANYEECVYVLHAFVKKSTDGIKTSQHDQDLIARHYQEAKRQHAYYLQKQKEKK